MEGVNLLVSERTQNARAIPQRANPPVWLVWIVYGAGGCHHPMCSSCQLPNRWAAFVISQSENQLTWKNCSKGLVACELRKRHQRGQQRKPRQRQVYFLPQIKHPMAPHQETQSSEQSNKIHMKSALIIKLKEKEKKKAMNWPEWSQKKEKIKQRISCGIT